MCEQLVDAGHGGVTGRDLECRRQELGVVARAEQLHGKGIAHVEFSDLGELQKVRSILVGRGADAAKERLADNGAPSALQHIEHMSARPVSATRDLRNQPRRSAGWVDRGQGFGSRNRYQGVGVVCCGSELSETVGIAQIALRLNRHESRGERRMPRLLAYELRKSQALRQRDQPVRGRALQHASRVNPQPQKLLAIAATQLRCRG